MVHNTAVVESLWLRKNRVSLLWKNNYHTNCFLFRLFHMFILRSFFLQDVASTSAVSNIKRLLDGGHWIITHTAAAEIFWFIQKVCCNMWNVRISTLNEWSLFYQNFNVIIIIQLIYVFICIFIFAQYTFLNFILNKNYVQNSILVNFIKFNEYQINLFSKAV